MSLSLCPGWPFVKLLFTDILPGVDECTIDDVCGTDAFCTNNNGSYDCTCDKINGFFCSECLSNIQYIQLCYETHSV